MIQNQVQQGGRLQCDIGKSVCVVKYFSPCSKIVSFNLCYNRTQPGKEPEQIIPPPSPNFEIDQ